MGRGTILPSASSASIPLQFKHQASQRFSLTRTSGPILSIVPARRSVRLKLRSSLLFRNLRISRLQLLFVPVNRWPPSVVMLCSCSELAGGNNANNCSEIIEQLQGWTGPYIIERDSRDIRFELQMRRGAAPPNIRPFLWNSERIEFNHTRRGTRY